MDKLDSVRLITESYTEDALDADNKLLSALAEVPIEAPQKLYVVKASMCSRELFIGTVSLFRNGREQMYTPKGERYPFGGDMKLYWCPSCEGVLDPMWRLPDEALCHHCNSRHSMDDLIGEYVFRHPPEVMIRRFMEIYRRVLFCDIYVMRNINTTPIDLRLTGKGLDALHTNVHEGKRVVYPFRSIMRDLRHNADMERRFRDFLSTV